MKINSVRFVATCFLLCIVASAKAQDKIQLRLRLHQGQTFDQGFAWELKISNLIPKRRSDTVVTNHFQMHNEVLSVGKDGTIKLKTTYQAVAGESVETNGGKAGSKMSYDSTKPHKKITPETQSFAAMVGQSLIITVSPRGEVLKVDGVDALVQRMATGLKNPSITSLLKQSLEGQGKLIAGMVVFPDSLVSIGESWNASTVQSTSAAQLTSEQYTLMSLQNGIATLAVHNGSPHKSTSSPGNINVSSYYGVLNGVMHVDEQSGLIRDFEMHARTAQRISLTVPKGFSEGTNSTPSDFWVYTQSTMRGWITKLP